MDNEDYMQAHFEINVRGSTLEIEAARHGVTVEELERGIDAIKWNEPPPPNPNDADDFDLDIPK